MKEKNIKIKVNNITTKQWTNLLLELNLIKKAWKPYGVDMELSAPGLKAILLWGKKVNEYVKTDRQDSNRVQQNKRS